MTKSEIDERVTELKKRSRALDASDARMVAEQWEMCQLLLDKLQLICAELKNPKPRPRREWFGFGPR
jgi:uncharacterized coiled-coil protein SlyX